MRNWSPLWSMIVDSSIWDEPDHVCKVFLTMLALKDSSDICALNAYQLAQRSRKTEAEVLDALKILSSPDRRRIEKQEHEGRRIQAVEDGWLILNGQKYRDLMTVEKRRASWRRAQARKRALEREKLTAQKPMNGELQHKRDYENGVVDENNQPIEKDKECPI